ncbi:MAG: glycoside hydrolase family 16 protein [Coriobacteriia bacterium]
MPRCTARARFRVRGGRLALASLVCAIAAAAIVQSACIPRYQPKGALIFEEDFAGEAVDLRRWQTEMAWGRYTTGQLEHYDPSALLVRDGGLTIVASEDTWRDRPYRSGVIATFGRHEFTYGYFEIRARMPKGRGLWPAFWLRASDSDSGAEIDVVEFLGHEPRTVHMALHYDTAGGGHLEPQHSFTGPDFTADHHTYAIDWSPDAVVWYIDGVERWRRTEGVPSEPMYLIANLSVGGEWPGSPDGDTGFPARYEIDWIRVYAP